MQIEVISSSVNKALLSRFCCSLDLRTSAHRSRFDGAPPPTPSPSLDDCFQSVRASAVAQSFPAARDAFSCRLPYGSAHSAHRLCPRFHASYSASIGQHAGAVLAVSVAIAYRSTITKHIAYPPAGANLMTHSTQHASYKNNCRLQWRLRCCCPSPVLSPGATAGE